MKSLLPVNFTSASRFKEKRVKSTIQAHYGLSSTRVTFCGRDQPANKTLYRQFLRCDITNPSTVSWPLPTRPCDQLGLCEINERAL